MSPIKKGTSHSTQVKKLNRIEGQIRGILKMIEDERYCLDILTQFKAVKAAITSVERNIINEHMNHCVRSAINSKNNFATEKVMNEIQELIKSAKS